MEYKERHRVGPIAAAQKIYYFQSLSTPTYLFFPVNLTNQLLPLTYLTFKNLESQPIRMIHCFGPVSGLDPLSRISI